MRMPVIFSGHGDPMIALRKDKVSATFEQVGKQLISAYGKPRAILAISAHWYTHGNLLQKIEKPPKINDMFGFPKELYDLKYQVKGCAALSDRVQEILGAAVKIDNDWGIDHGVWSVFVHMFPAADIPVVELSVNVDISAEEIFEIGTKLSDLRAEGYLIFGSGNIVHNLREVDWDNFGGTEKTLNFNQEIIDAVKAKDIKKILDYDKIHNSDYAIPTIEHFLPLIYCLGAADGDDATVFNDVCNLGSMAMTGFIFESV
ncbi:MAG: dioxygenase [Selenomonadaceae bacterium]|nr:dioxygenase [Selenomonadaceae bacterium]